MRSPRQLPASDEGLFARAGDPIHDLDVELYTEETTKVMPLCDALGDGKALLVGMPGAFTPTCTNKHLPDLVKTAPKFKELGVDTIAVITTNDRYVNEAWRVAIEASMNETTTLTMLSDGDGDAIKALGLADDMGYGMGVRSTRFALLAENRSVVAVSQDRGMDELKVRGAGPAAAQRSPASYPPFSPRRLPPPSLHPTSRASVDFGRGDHAPPAT